jgi:hypothetical protein
MNQAESSWASGNRCGHDPKNPILSPLNPNRKGEGDLLRILSLAAERANEWFWNPNQCPEPQSNPDRQTRSERREAVQVVLEHLLSRLDLSALCVGVPSPGRSFIDVEMKSIVVGTGLGKRRCERAIAQLKTADFMTVDQPRHRNEDGKYTGLRAVRVITRKLFEWLNLGPMLDRERRRASRSMAAKASGLGKSLSDLVKRKTQDLSRKFGLNSELKKRREVDRETKLARNRLLRNLMKAGAEIKDSQKAVNRRFDFSPDWSPGQGDLREL